MLFRAQQQALPALPANDRSGLTIERGKNLAAKPSALEFDDAIGKITACIEKGQSCGNGIAINYSSRIGNQHADGIGDVFATFPIMTARHSDKFA